MTTESFYKKMPVHRINNYDYSMVEYINYYTKNKIICKEHGQFEQTSNNHLQRNQMSKCFGNKKKTTDNL
jgi:hypothetical protein